MSFWQPKSVLQLVVVGFFTTVAPLCLAILYTVHTLSDLSEQSRAVTGNVISINRQGQSLQTELLDLERRARQYVALNNDELLQLFRREKQGCLDKLEQLRLATPGSGTLLQELEDTVTVLDPVKTTLLNDQFSQLLSLRTSLAEWLREYVDHHITEHEANAKTVRDSLLVMVFLLALATLLLMLFFSYWINRPVRAVVSEIKRLGGGDLSSQVAISGPQEIRVLGNELEWLRLRLNDTEQQKMTFLRHISHELKTPLASLREGTDLLADEVPGPLLVRQREIVAIVQQNGYELQRLIENLLDYNQLPHQGLRLEPVDLPAMGKLLFENYQMTSENKGLNVSSQWRLERWVADRSKLKTALDNLISNAVNYTPDGEAINLDCRQEGESLVIEVANTGLPIPEEERARLFEPFFQGSTERRGAIKGSGIGLSLARECMQAQGGSLEIVSHPTFEVCFRLTCPFLEQTP